MALSTRHQPLQIKRLEGQLERYLLQVGIDPEITGYIEFVVIAVPTP